MAWDASRPVPFKRLVKEWVVYAAIMVVIFLVLLRDSTSTGGLFIGLAISLPLYIGLSYVMAKLGYQRKSLAELRTPRASPSEPAAPSPTSTDRSRPAPTRRTSAGANRPQKTTRRKH